MKRISVLFLVSITAILAGCKLSVIVVEGGEVQSEGSGTCSAGAICIVEVPDTNFAETFYAKPIDGWYFHRWHSAEGFFCGDVAYSTCRLSFEDIPVNQTIEDLVASNEVFYLMPVFKDYPRATIVEGKPRTVRVDGKVQEWLQVTDFDRYSYDQIREVCPEGICSGTLPGSTIDLTGYFWASSNDVSLLHSAYLYAGKPIFEDFKHTASDIERIIRATLSDRLILRQSEQNSEDTESFVNVAEIWEDRLDPANDFLFFTEFPYDPAFAFGPWFWRPLD